MSSEPSSAALVIAIDGPAASGKGTLARRLAEHFGLRHLDTGLTYRAVASAWRDSPGGGDPKDVAVRGIGDKVVLKHSVFRWLGIFARD